MAGRNQLTGIGWHEEWHTVDKKKEKAADCIYLAQNRICRNKACHLYGEKCFVATHCKYRRKSSDKQSHIPQKTEATFQKQGYLVSSCSLPKNCNVYHKKYGMGRFCKYDEVNRMISIEFESQTVKFKYPDAFLNKFLYGNDIVDKRVYMDSLLAEQE